MIETLPYVPASNLLILSFEFMTRGATVWFTGLSRSGTTPMSKRVETILKDRGVPVERLDGDIVPAVSKARDLGFSKEENGTRT